MAQVPGEAIPVVMGSLTWWKMAASVPLLESTHSFLHTWFHPDPAVGSQLRSEVPWIYKNSARLGHGPGRILPGSWGRILSPFGKLETLQESSIDCLPAFLPFQLPRVSWNSQLQSPVQPTLDNQASTPLLQLQTHHLISWILSLCHPPLHPPTLPPPHTHHPGISVKSALDTHSSPSSHLTHLGLGKGRQTYQVSGTW